MKAVYFSEFDGKSIELKDVPDPRPLEPGEVLVAVRAAGLNRADLMQAKGMYPPPAGFSPSIPDLNSRARSSRPASALRLLRQAIWSWRSRPVRRKPRRSLSTTGC
ncbi:MAG TPA: hypothetical protein VGO43_04715 [Pyrinomonadaceae bacterium]|nr:hypothetical protein [Pyrinomonadaceae bacterium]